jgi:hypothetical protein
LKRRSKKTARRGFGKAPALPNTGRILLDKLALLD